ncbi:hypothetical protein BH09VER1_BH09VER1_27250 [soil metagenome]
MLQIDFYESGIGETIVITFPSGGIGIIDAHPSAEKTRSDITEIVAGKKIHFVCLTHPHSDHGEDLPKILATAKPDFFWHTVDDFTRLISCLEGGSVSFQTNYKDFTQDMHKGWPQFMVKLFSTAGRNKIPHRTLKDNLVPFEIDGVSITALSPDEEMKEKWIKAYQSRIESGRIKALPSPNFLSAILSVQYGGVVALLGGDALKVNWNKAIPNYLKRKLPKATVLKVPHHGARNAFEFSPKGHKANYLSLLRADQKPIAILFAGDVDHPDKEVFARLNKASDVYWFHNPEIQSPDPLALLQHSGFKPVSERKPVYSSFTVKIAPSGEVEASSVPI